LTGVNSILPEAGRPRLEPAPSTGRDELRLGQGVEESLMADIAELDERTRTELEAAAFRTLVEHFRAHPEVQNIDLMNLAGFCRNCLSKWYRAAAEERGLDLSYEQARELVYGMPYAEWKARHQTEATLEQQALFAERHPEHS
jgi:uncharacterized protein